MQKLATSLDFEISEFGNARNNNLDQNFNKKNDEDIGRIRVERHTKYYRNFIV